MTLHCCVEYVMCQHWWEPNCLVCSNSVNSVGNYGAKPLPLSSAGPQGVQGQKGDRGSSGSTGPPGVYVAMVTGTHCC